MQFKARIGVAVLAIAMFPCVNAQAEEAVFVTATRFPEKRLEHPVGVTVITRDEIASSPAASVPGLLSRYAGINMRDNAGSPDVQIDMRGFGMSGAQNTLVLLDGQRMNENELAALRWSSIPLEAVERIEIQRGGGAVLYGGGATGGSINIITRSPTAGGKTADVAASYGSYNATGLSAGFNLAGTNTGFALTASQSNSDNYRANNRLEQNRLLGDLRWTGDRGGVVLKFGLDDQSLRLPGARTNVQLQSDRRGASTPGDYSSRDANNAALSGRYQFDRFDAAAEVSFRDTKRNAFFDNYFGPYGQTSFVDTQGKVWAFTPHATLPFRFLGREHTLIVGADLDYWDYLSLRATGPATLDTPVADIAATQRDQAIYAQNHTALGAATKLSLGVRAQRVEIAAKDRANALPGASATQARSPRSWEVALRHQINAATALYGKFGASFRIATLDEMFNSCGYFDMSSFACFSTVTPLEPQTSRDREIGIEYKQRQGRLRASYYRMDLRNEIHFNALTFSNMNLSPTRREGIEIEGGWKLNPRVDLFGSYTHARAVFREGLYAGVDVSGNSVPLVPRHMAKLGVTWLLREHTRISGALAYVGKQHYDNDQANNFAGGQMPAYTTVDLKLSQLVGPWKLTLSGNNLTGKKYYTYAIRGGGATASNFNAYPAAERNFMFTAEYRFR